MDTRKTPLLSVKMKPYFRKSFSFFIVVIYKIAQQSFYERERLMYTFISFSSYSPIFRIINTTCASVTPSSHNK